MLDKTNERGFIVSGKRIYSDELRLKVVQEYMSGHSGGYGVISEKYHIPTSCLKSWIASYKQGGFANLVRTNRTYTGAFKLYVVEYMRKTGLSYLQTAAFFGIPSLTTVWYWDNIYRQQGKKVLLEENRGRKAMKNKSVKSIKKTKKQNTDNKDLLAELQYLRMENEYLKKLNALVLEREKLEQEKK